MKKFLTTLFLLLPLSLALAASTPTEIKNEQHRAAYNIVLASGEKRAGCSATAISEHVLLTAEHCDVKDAKIYIDDLGKQHPLAVAEKYYDRNDHMLLVVPGVSFKHFANYDPAKYKGVTMGDHIYMWGNPDLIADQYREGYVTGRVLMPDPDSNADATVPFTMIAVPVVGGDSGSAIYAASDNRIVGVTTYGIFGGLTLGMFELTFTSEQVAQAEGLGNFTYVTDTRPVVNVQAAKDSIVQTENGKTAAAIAVLTIVIVFYFVLSLCVSGAPRFVWRVFVAVSKFIWGFAKKIYRRLRTPVQGE